MSSESNTLYIGLNSKHYGSMRTMNIFSKKRSIFHSFSPLSCSHFAKKYISIWSSLGEIYNSISH